MSADAEAPCPCGTGRSYQACCHKIHADGAGLGRTAEELMRSRYSAYVRHDEDYLLRSWHVDTRPDSVSFDPNLAWLGLEIVETAAGTGFDTEGTVEFRARFRRGTEHLELHEVSSFARVDGVWVYLHGE